MSTITPEPIAKPYAVIHEQGEYLLVRDGILVSDDQKLLLVLHELRDILAEQRERRIGDDDVGLLQELNAFGAAEIAVPLELPDRHLVVVDDQVAVPVALVDLADRPFAVALREKIDILALVARRDKTLKLEFLEVVGEVLEEVAPARIVAVAEHDLALEMFLVVPQLVLDVHELRIELVLLAFLRQRQIGRPAHDLASEDEQIEQGNQKNPCHRVVLQLRTRRSASLPRSEPDSRFCLKVGSRGHPSRA